MDQGLPKPGAPVKRPHTGVGVVVWRGAEVLLIRRGKQPFIGQWSIPGGTLEFGETLHQAALRELKEETAIEAEIAGLIDVYESLHAEAHYVMIDYVARWTAGEPVAGDDATDARFFTFEEAVRTLQWDTARRALEHSLEVLARPNHAVIRP
jgi:8-oxo-dGTP diphosphatase